jgi:hypothetical protein
MGFLQVADKQFLAIPGSGEEDPPGVVRQLHPMIFSTPRDGIRHRVILGDSHTMTGVARFSDSPTSPHGFGSALSAACRIGRNIRARRTTHREPVHLPRTPR